MYLEGQGSQRGYAMAALLVSIAVMAVLMSAAMPVWRHAAQREKEAELVFRGEQYARAIALYQRKLPGTFPPSVDVLVQQRFLRKKYKDPMTPDGEFQIIPVGGGVQQGGNPQQPGGRSGGPAGPGGRSGASSIGAQAGTPGGTQSSPFGGGQFGTAAGVMGVVSKSKEASIRLYKGRGHYNEWQFLFASVANQPGGRGRGTPGGAGGTDRPGPGGRGGPGIGGPGGRGGRGTPGRGNNPGGRGPGRGFGPGIGRGGD